MECILWKFLWKGCVCMFVIVGVFKINVVGMSGVVYIGDCIIIFLKVEVKIFVGVGSFNIGDNFILMNYRNLMNVYDNDVID